MTNQPDFSVIHTERLDLIVGTPALYEASLTGDQVKAEALIGACIPPDWFTDRGILDIFQAKLQHDPLYQPWSLRAVVLRADRKMIGHAGFHTPPAPEYLEALAPGGIELGYTIYPEYRQQGYAREATQALIEWAQRTYGLTRFVLSISPDNVPSTRIALGLGFTHVGEHIDLDDGIEIVYRLG